MKMFNRPALLSTTAVASLLLLQCGSVMAQTPATSNDINLTGVTGCVRINGSPVSAPGTCTATPVPMTPPAVTSNPFAQVAAAALPTMATTGAVPSSTQSAPAVKALAEAAAAAYKAEAEAMVAWKAASTRVTSLTAAAGAASTAANSLGGAASAAEKSLGEALSQANMLAQQAALKNASLVGANPADRIQIQREADDLAIKSTLAQLKLAPLQAQFTQGRAMAAPLSASSNQAQTDLTSAAAAEAAVRQKLVVATTARQAAVAAMKAAINGAGGQ